MKTWCLRSNSALHSKIKAGPPDSLGAPRQSYNHELVAIVVVVIPIASVTPPVPVFVPPAVPFVPAMFPRFVQFVPRMIRLPAVPAVVLHGFVEFVVRLGDTALAIAAAIRTCARRSGNGRQAHECHGSEPCLPERPPASRFKVHVLSILPYSPRLGRGDVLLHRTLSPGECSKRLATH